VILLHTYLIAWQCFKSKIEKISDTLANQPFFRT